MITHKPYWPQQALITIDGKATNLTGDDLVSVLRSMQANTIDNIELITSGSAKYDASSGGIINIITKKGMARGCKPYPYRVCRLRQVLQG